MTNGRSCDVGDEVEVPWEPLMLAGQLIVNSTRLPRARQHELGVGEFERAWLLGTLPLFNEASAKSDRIDSVLISFVGDGAERAVLNPYGNRVYRSQWTVEEAAHGRGCGRYLGVYVAALVLLAVPCPGLPRTIGFAPLYRVAVFCI